jgi:hypothetical protein
MSKGPTGGIIFGHFRHAIRPFLQNSVTGGDAFRVWCFIFDSSFFQTILGTFIKKKLKLLNEGIWVCTKWFKLCYLAVSIVKELDFITEML